MKPVLLDYPVVTLHSLLLIFIVILSLITLLLLIMRFRQGLTRELLLTALVFAAMTGVILGVIYYMGHFRMNAYGSMLIIGFFVGIISAVKLAKRRGIPPEKIIDLALMILLAAIIGARLLYILITKDSGPIINLPELLRSGLGGLSFHGGLIAGLLTAIIYCWRMKISFWRLADSMAPSVAIGYAVTRIGCFLNGCCYGRCTDMPWAVTFPATATSGAVSHVHPTQIYASLMMLTAYFLLLWLSRGDSLHRAGRIFMVYLMLAGLERVVMEIFRQPDPNYSFFITPAQWFSMIIIIGGIAGWFLLPSQKAIPENDVSNSLVAEKKKYNKHSHKRK